MRGIIQHSLAFVLYLLAQVLLFDHLVLWQMAHPFVFILFLFTLPFDWPIPLVYLLAFGMGLSVDVLSDTYANGLHAFSAVLAVSLRRQLLAVVSSSNFRNPGEVTLEKQSAIWYASYLFPLILVHHTAYFLLEAFTFAHFLPTLAKIFLSTGYSFLLCFLLTYVFYRR